LIYWLLEHNIGLFETTHILFSLTE